MGALHQDCNARECFSPTAARVTLFTPSILQCSLKSQRLQLRLTRLRLKGVDVCSYCISIFTVALLRELGKLPGHVQAVLQKNAQGVVICHFQSGGCTLPLGHDALAEGMRSVSFPVALGERCLF